MEGSTAASGVPTATATRINAQDISSTAASSGGNTNSNGAGTVKGKGKGRGRATRNQDPTSTSKTPKRAQNTRDMQLVVVEEQLHCFDALTGSGSDPPLCTPQKSRLARQGEGPYRGRQAGPSGATARARKSAGGVEKSPPCGLMH